MLCLVVTLTACGKKEPITSTEETIEPEETEATTEDEFAITDNQNLPGYEVRETRKSKEEQQEEREVAIEQLQEDYQESHKEVLESAASEKAEREVIESGLEVDVTELEDYYYSTLVSKIKSQSYSSLDDVYNEIDLKYTAYSNDIRDKLKVLLKEVWDYWEEQYKKVDSQERPWTEEELAENPDLASYTREEVEEINRKARELGIVFD